MIKYSYRLERKISETEVQEFYPRIIPTELPNLVYIEGPNSLGKSTLLNIIALAFFGANSSKIHPALRVKMDSLLNSEYQKLFFEIEISSGREKLVIKSGKIDPSRSEIVFEESLDGKPFRPLSPESVNSKYNLIYDIPSNPTERMYDLLKELQEEQTRFGNKFSQLGWLIREVIKEIDSQRNPKRLNDIRTGLETNTKEFKELSSNLPKIEAFLEALEKNSYAYWYYYYANECDSLENEKQRLENARVEAGKNNRTISRRIHKIRNEIPRLQGDIFSLYSEITKLMSTNLTTIEKERFKIWKRMDIYTSEISDLEQLKNEATHFWKFFGAEMDTIECQNSFRDAHILSRIIQSLEDYKDSNVLIAKLKVTIGQIIEMMKEENEKNFVLLSKHDTFERIRNLLKDLIDGIKLLQDELKAANLVIVNKKEIAEEFPSSYFEGEQRLDDASKALVQACTNRDNYAHKCVSKNIDLKQLENSTYAEMLRNLPQNSELGNFLSLTEQQIKQKIAEVETEVGKKTERVKTLAVIIEQYQKEKDELEKLKPHKFEKYKENLSVLFQKSQMISSKLLSEYNDNIKSLISQKVKESDIERFELKRKYYDEVSKYLASRIGIFRHIDDTYEAKSADLISGVIITTTEKTIHLVDMGMGQSQSTYIKGLLNAKNDNRKIIALFDEIASMDSNSLKPIFTKLRELYEEKRLLLGIMVQRSDKLKVESLEQ